VEYYGKHQKYTKEPKVSERISMQHDTLLPKWMSRTDAAFSYGVQVVADGMVPRHVTHFGRWLLRFPIIQLSITAPSTASTICLTSLSGWLSIGE
jgi:hypothetical protein